METRIKALSTATKEKVLEKFSINGVEESQLNTTLDALIEDRGITHMVDGLENKTLDVLYEPMSKTDQGLSKKGDKVPRSAKIKRIADYISEKKIGNYLDTVEPAQLKEIAESLGVEELEKGKKGITQLKDAVMNLGASAVFGLFDLAFLRAICEEMGMKDIKPEHSKNELCDALMAGAKTLEAPAKKKKAKKEEEKPSAAKPDIAKGVSKVDLYHWFYTKDLQQYCSDHKLQSSGSKKELIKTILDSFEGKIKAAGKPKAKRADAPSGDKKAPVTKKTKKEEPAAADAAASAEPAAAAAAAAAAAPEKKEEEPKKEKKETKKEKAEREKEAKKEEVKKEAAAAAAEEPKKAEEKKAEEPAKKEEAKKETAADKKKKTNGKK